MTAKDNQAQPMLPELKNYYLELDLQIKDRFKYVKFCGKGKYGFVAKIEILPNNDSKGYARAIKISLPENFENLDNNKLTEARKEFLTEIKALHEFNHPNIPQIYGFGEARAVIRYNNENDTVPFYIMEYLDGENLEIFMSNEKNLELINENFFLGLVEQTLSALLCCHHHGIVHLDIKPNNIFVVHDKTEVRFVLADFGKSKNLLHIGENVYGTMGGRAFDWVHPDLYRHIRDNRVNQELFCEYGYLFDLYSLGKVFQFVLKKITSLSEKCTCWDFFINDLCWNESHPNNFSKFIQYKSTKEAFTKALKLINFRVNKGLPLLYDNDKSSTIRLTENETIPFPKFLKAYVDTPEFQKLRNINQLAGTDLVYPGATHTRFIHSLGVYSKSILYIKSLLTNPLFYYLYDDFEIENLIICALLHDLGHYPFSHYIEEIQGLDTLSVVHENLTEKILSNKLSMKMAACSVYSDKYLSNTKIGIIKKMCISSIGDLLGEDNRLEMILKILRGEGKYILFKNIIASSIDCDKLDYLSRDSKYTGVTYGKMIDVERFIMSLTINYSKAIEKRNSKEFPDLFLAITPKGVSAVESIIHSRYSLFSEVYWHKTCRATTAMIKDAFWYASVKITQDEFEWASLMLNDDEFLLFIAEKLDDIEISVDLLGGIRNGYNRRIYKRFKTFSDAWEKGKCQQLLGKLTNNFVLIHKKKDNFISMMNETEKNNKWKEIKKHHLIIDIPNMGVDLDFSLKVKYSDDIEGKKYYDFNKISMTKADINVSKKIRFFCHPDYLDQINALGKKIDKYIDETLLA